MKQVLSFSLFILVLLLSACGRAEQPLSNDVSRDKGDGVSLVEDCATSTQDEITALPSEKNELKEVAIFNVYFDNSKLNPGMADCSQVFPVSRTAMNEDLIKTALQELFKGPSESEKRDGYASSFSSSTQDILKNVKLENDALYINLIDIRQLISSAGSSCGGAHFFASINKTVKQFLTDEKIIFAIENNPETFYEWTQIGCPPEGSSDNYCDITPFISL